MQIKRWKHVWRFNFLLNYAEYLKLQENHHLCLNVSASFLKLAKMSKSSHCFHISPTALWLHTVWLEGMVSFFGSCICSTISVVSGVACFTNFMLYDVWKNMHCKSKSCRRRFVLMVVTTALCMTLLKLYQGITYTGMRATPNDGLCFVVNVWVVSNAKSSKRIRIRDLSFEMCRTFPLCFACKRTFLWQ